MSDDICNIPGCIKPREKYKNRRICSMHRNRYARHKSYDLPVLQFPDGIVKLCKKHGPLTEQQVKLRKEGKPWLLCLQCVKEYEDRFIENNGPDARKKYQNKRYQHG